LRYGSAARVLKALRGTGLLFDRDARLCTVCWEVAQRFAGFTMRINATKFEMFLESGIAAGLEFAIRYFRKIETIPEQDRRELITGMTHPFGC
jgi:hypothetical protein